MIVARLDVLKFHQQDDKHTVAYAKLARALCDQFDGSQRHGDMKAVIGKDGPEAIDRLRQLVGNRLARYMRHHDYDRDDFSFSLRYEQVDEQGGFYLSLSTLDSGPHKPLPFDERKEVTP